MGENILCSENIKIISTRRHSASLAIREMQFNTTMRYNLILSKMARTESTISSVDETWRR